MKLRAKKQKDISHHQLALVENVPLSGTVLFVPQRQNLPVDRVYSVRSKNLTIVPNKNIQEIPKTSRKSMFFRGRSRDIENDPFLRRLARLK